MSFMWYHMQICEEDKHAFLVLYNNYQLLSYTCDINDYNEIIVDTRF
jgi:hypothetical protein